MNRHYLIQSKLLFPKLFYFIFQACPLLRKSNPLFFLNPWSTTICFKNEQRINEFVLLRVSFISTNLRTILTPIATSPCWKGAMSWYIDTGRKSENNSWQKDRKHDKCNNKWASNKTGRYDGRMRWNESDKLEFHRTHITTYWKIAHP